VLQQKFGYPVDRPAATWGPSFRPRTLRSGKNLTITLKEPALVHWGINGWQNASDVETNQTGLGVFIVELPVRHLKVGETIQFSLKWSATGVWEGQDHEVMVVESNEDS
jgi:glucoamylase